MSHGAYHVLREHVALGQANEDISSLHGLLKGLDVGAVGSELHLLLIHVVAALIDDTTRVEHDNVFVPCAKRTIELCAAYGRSTSAIDNNLGVFYLLAGYLQGIEETSGRDDSRSMLIIVHHGNVESLLKPILNIKTLWSLDVLKIYTAKCRGDFLDSLAELLGVFFIHLYVEYINATVYLEQKPFTFHDRLTAHGPYIAKA